MPASVHGTDCEAKYIWLAQQTRAAFIAAVPSATIVSARNLAGNPIRYLGLLPTSRLGLIAVHASHAHDRHPGDSEQVSEK